MSGHNFEMKSEVRIDEIPLKQEYLDRAVHDIIASIQETLVNKAKEYASDEDRAQNFTDAARLDECTRERALWGMMLKHLVSVKKIVHDLDKEKMTQPKIFREKIRDSINYLILLESLLALRYNLIEESEVAE